MQVHPSGIMPLIPHFMASALSRSDYCFPHIHIPCKTHWGHSGSRRHRDLNNPLTLITLITLQNKASMKTYPMGSKAKIHQFKPNNSSPNCLPGRALCELQPKKTKFILAMRNHCSSQSLSPKRNRETGTAQVISTTESIRKGPGNRNYHWFCIRYLLDQIVALAYCQAIKQHESPGHR